MRPDVAGVVRDADISDWKPVALALGDHEIEVLVPPGTKTLGMREYPPLSRPRQEIRLSLEEPIGTPPLPRILEAKGKPAGKLTVCIATSHITRPVPYKGEGGIFEPLLEILHECGIRRENVTLLVGTGTHRPSTPEEKIEMFGKRVAAAYRIIDHSCDDESMLTHIGGTRGGTRGGTEVHINRHFVEADVRIVTGLVEAHFMAGVSAGRKAICPVPRRGARGRPHGRGGFHRQHRAEPAPRADRRLLRGSRAVPRKGGGAGPPHRGDPGGAGI